MATHLTPLTLDLEGTTIPFVVQATSQQRIELTFDTSPPVLLIQTPSGKMDSAAWKFVRQKEKWILNTYNRAQHYYRQRLTFKQKLEAGIILYQGVERPFILQKGPHNFVRLNEGILTIQYRPANQNRSHLGLLYSALRSLAKHKLSARVAELAHQTHSTYQTIRIKDQKTKWGSCSSKRNLNFNWHAVLLPPQLVDYLIIHELMHLREMNHSPRFWAEVGKYWPAYKQSEQELNSYSWLIGIFEWLVDLE